MGSRGQRRLSVKLECAGQAGGENHTFILHLISLVQMSKCWNKSICLLSVLTRKCIGLTEYGYVLLLIPGPPRPRRRPPDGLEPQQTQKATGMVSVTSDIGGLIPEVICPVPQVTRVWLSGAAHWLTTTRLLWKHQAPSCSGLQPVSSGQYVRKGSLPFFFPFSFSKIIQI